MSEKVAGIGYGKPPPQYQYQPGQSGNPSGRPKKSVQLVEVLLAEANALITINENGNTYEVKKLHAMAKTLFALALKGDVKAMGLFFKIWSPTEISAKEWHDEQNHKRVQEAIEGARAILGRNKAKRETEESVPDGADPEMAAFCKAQEEAEKKGQLLTFDQWQENNGVPPQYIGDL